ncbi:MAG: hypothetical protein ACP5P3_05775 [Ignavibacteria bacterium]
MKKLSFLASFFIIFLFASNYLVAQEFPRIEAKGKVIFFNLEGGFYGITTENGSQYIPLNLKEEFKQDNLKVYFRGTLRPDVVTTYNWGESIQLDDIYPLDAKEKEFSIYEWGVALGCYTDNNFFNTSRPEVAQIVKLPVIYVEGDDVDFNLKVTFNTGKPTDSYPKTPIQNSQLIWNNIIASDEIKFQKSLKLEDSRDLVSLEEIKQTLNDVSTKWLHFNQINSKFIFYEGEMVFSNKVEVEFNTDLAEVVVKNNFDYTVYNVIVTTQKGSFFDPQYMYFRVDSLLAGEYKGGKFQPLDYKLWIDDLKSLAFPESVINSFHRIWFNPFASKTNKGHWANLIYRIPQSELEKLIHLEFDPPPSIVKRVLYIDVDISKLLK